MNSQAQSVSGLFWKVKRMRAMDADEVVYRFWRAIQIWGERHVSSLAGYEKPIGETGQAWLTKPARDFESALYVSAADKILAGRFNLFGAHEMHLGFPPVWNRDPKTGIDGPLGFGKTMDYRNESLVGDIKYLWELNRHLELVTLAQAYHLTGDRSYAEGARLLLESWFRQCPYMRGPNWISSLELAIRLVNWTYAWHLLGGQKSSVLEDERGRQFKRTWLENVYRHMSFISGHLSHYSSANNHLIGEYMGLFCGAVTWPLWRECGEWRELAKRGIQTEALRQIGLDGVNREQALWYEHAVADMLLHAALIGRANDIEFSKAYWGRLAAILEHIASVMDISGEVPMFGDSDDAVLVRFSQEPGFNVYRSLLATGSVLFKSSDFKAKAGCFDDKSRWLLGDDAAVHFEELPEAIDKLPVRREFADGGYWILGDGFETTDEIRIVADAGPLGYLSIAAHGHADALSFVLSARGREFLVDPGTYAFHTRKKWRDYFRGTSAHNTMRVDGQDQSVMGGNFLWLKHAHAECNRFDCSEDSDEWEASHDGYLRLREPVRHRRRIAFNKSASRIEVTDTLEGIGSHWVELFWHFAEECHVDADDAGFLVRHADIEMRMLPPFELDSRLVRGSETPPLGWISRRFDKKTPTTTLVCEGPVQVGTALRTVLQFTSTARHES